jgi:putative protease
MPETKVGIITHYFAKVGVAVIKATEAPLEVGDTIRIKGHTTDHTQVIDSMQVEHQPIVVLEVGKDAGLKVGAHCHEHDAVYKVTP